MRLFLFRAVISCAEGDWIAIARHLAKDARRALRRFLLGESESVRFHSDRDGIEVVYVLNLTQTRWHKFARRLTGRASFYQKWLRRQPGHSELSLNALSDSDRKA